MNGFPTYDDQQAVMTMNRAAYGDQQAAIMSGAGGFYGGAATGLNNLASDIGSLVRPITYTPPARTYVGSGGYYVQHTGLMRGLASQIGIGGGDVPRGISAYDYHTNQARDVGERIGTGLTSTASVAGGIGAGVAMSGATTFAGQMVGGAVGAAVGSVFGPVGTVAGAVGGRFIGGLAGGLAGYGLGMSGAGLITDSISQRREIQSFLSSSSFRFAGTGSALNAGNISGAGMSRDTRRDIADFVRSRDVADPTMDMGELSQILQTGAQQGLFTGSQDLDDFKSKYKSLVENVKAVTKTLRTTLEEGVKVVKDLKGIGVTGQDVQGMVSMAASTGAVAGRTAAEMMNVGLQGAEMYRGTGIGMNIGAQANMMNLASIRAARDAGVLSQEAIAQAGGEQAMAQQQTARGLQFAQTQFGRGMNAAFFQGGGFNAGAFNQAMMGGGMDFTSQAQLAAGNLSSPAAIINYQANQHKFLTEMGNQFGGQGLQVGQMAATASYATYLAQQTGASREDAYRFAAQSLYNMSPADIDAQMGQMKGAGDVFAAAQKGAQANALKQAVDEGYENFVFNKLGARIGDAVGGAVDVVAAPMNRFIDRTSASFERFRQEQVLGLRRVSMTDARAGAFTDVTISQKALDKAEEQIAKGPLELDVGGILSTSAGERLDEAISSGLLSNMGITDKNVERQRLFLDSRQKLRDRDLVLNEGNVGFDRRVSVDLSAVQEAASAKYANYDITVSEARKAQEKGSLDDVGGGLGRALLRGSSRFDEDDPSVTDKLAMASFGVSSFAELSKEQAQKLILQSSGTRFEKAFNAKRQVRKDVKNAAGVAGIARIEKAMKVFDSAEKSLESMLDLPDLNSEVTSKLAEAIVAQSNAAAEKDPEKKKALMKKASDKSRAVMVLAESEGVDPTAIDQMSSAIFTTDEKVKDAANLLGAVNVKVNELATERGSNLLADAAEAQLAGKSGLSESQRSAAKTAARALRGGITNLDDKQAKALEEAGVATGIMQQRQNLKDIEAADGLTGDKKINAVSEALRRSGLSGKDILQIEKDLKSGATDVDQISKRVEQEFARKIQGDDLFMAPGGSGAVGDNQGKSAMEQFAIQTSINTEILSAMQGLAARLRISQ